MRRSKSTVLVHLVWATLRRRPILDPAVDSLLTATLRRGALDAGCELIEVGIAHDHVHVLAELATTSSVAELAKRVKGSSAYLATQTRPLSRLRWQGGYWVESIAPCDVDAVTRYLRAQRSRHDDANPLEAWQTQEAQG
jgi:REP element-mobilizing transposase RayT